MDRNSWRRKELDGHVRLKIEEENGTLFSDEEKKRSNLSVEGRRCLGLFAALVILLVLSMFFVTVVWGNQNISVVEIGRSAMRRVQDLVDYFSGNHTQSAIQNFLMQFFCPVIAGAALSSAGASYQAVFHNPMASPTILGIQSGGTIGSLIYVLFFYEPMLTPLLTGGVATYDVYAAEYNSMTFFQKFGQYFFTLGGCIAVVLVVMLMAKIAGRGKIETVPLMVGGTIFSGAISSVVSLVEYYESAFTDNTTVTDTVQSLQSGAFSPVSQGPLLLSFAVTALVPFFVMLFMGNRLNIIAFGEEEARTLGISVRKERVVFILLATFMTASVIAFGGNIAFIGLVIPHLTRQIVGNDFRYLLPGSAFLGGIFLLAAFDVSYILNYMVNMGIVVSVAGSAVFSIFMIRYRRQGNADWA